MADLNKKQSKRLNKSDRNKLILTVIFAFIAVFYLAPIFLVLINSFKANAYVNTAPFAMISGSFPKIWAPQMLPSFFRSSLALFLS